MNPNEHAPIKPDALAWIDAIIGRPPRNNVIEFIPGPRPSIGKEAGGGQTAPLPKPRKDKRAPQNGRRKTAKKDAPQRVLDYLERHPDDAVLSVTQLWRRLTDRRIDVARSTVGKARRIFLTDGRE